MRDRCGFSLVEVLVAAAILAAGLASIAQLIGVAVVSNRTARETSDAVMLAFQKLEQLRGASFGELAAMPGGSLEIDTPDFFDEPAGYVRRWAVEPLPSRPTAGLVVHVRVLPRRSRASGSRTGAAPGEAQLAAVRMRSAP